MIEFFLFYLFALMAVVAGIAILFSKNIVRMAYCLIGMLLAVAGIYFLLGYYFLGTIQIIVYVGSVAVLVVFGVMLTSRQLATRLLPRPSEVLWLLFAAAAALAGSIYAILRTRWPAGVNQAANTVADIGRSLLGEFLGSFELSSILLLVALLGAAYLARPKVPTPDTGYSQKTAAFMDQKEKA